MKQPNFFIIGAPKCGTSAMYNYLTTHPNVLMSHPKEPGYWAMDYPSIRLAQSVRLDSVDDYLCLFRKADDRHQVIGEASTAYLSSEQAVANIRKFNAQAQLLVMLRNPVDFVVSFHNEKLFELNEDVADFEEAWKLQSERRQGRRIPKTCYEPKLLQYSVMGAFGTQMERLFQHADPSHVKVFLLEDLARDPAAVYRDLLTFLGLPDDGRREFPRINLAKQHRFRWLVKIYQPRRGVMAPTFRACRQVGRRIPGLRQIKDYMIKKPQKRLKVSAEVRRDLIEVFRPEIKKLAGLIDRDLTHWLA